MIKNKKNLAIHVLQILLIILFVFSITPKQFFQADTFFSVAVGERIVKYGFEEYDQLTFHENLRYIFLRWGYDVIVYFLYSLWGLTGTFVFTLIISATQGILYYLILNKITKKKLLSFFGTIISMYFLKSEFAGRAQILSFTLFIIQFYCIEQLVETNKNRYFVVLTILPLLLVNVHASTYPLYFVFFLPYIAEFILSKLKLKKDENTKIVIEDRNISKLIILMIIAVLLGFCSPCGVDTYTYVFKVMGAISAEFITEMLPVHLFDEIYITTTLCMYIAIIAFTKTKVRVTDAFLMLGITLMSFNTARYTFFYHLIATLCFYRTLNNFIDDYEINLEFINKKIKTILYILVMVYFAITSLNRFISNISNGYIDTQMFPENAVTYILNNYDVNEIKLFNHFNNGGYLELYKIPVFLDSRAEMYAEEFNDTTVLSDWYQAVGGIIHYDEVFEKYDITHVLLYNSELIKTYIDKDEEWKLVYQDDIFSLYESVDF